MSGRAGLPLIAAFETTYLPHHDLDVAELTDHAAVWRADVAAVAAAGVSRMRMALRWHRIEHRPGVYDWRETDAQFAFLREAGIAPIVDLVHHTSYPRWLGDGFRDPRFGPAFVRFARAVADRYDWIPAYTLFNEPFATLFLAGHEALWPPYDHGMRGFVRLALNIMPAVAEAAALVRERLPEAEHVWIDTCESHAGSPGAPARYAALANDRRHSLLDLAVHRDLDRSRPFLAELLGAGGERLFELPPLSIDVLGLDYYCHSEWWYDRTGGHSPSPHPVGFAALAATYAERYGVPVMLSETNIRGTQTDRISWLKYTLEECEAALADGVDLRGYCWFPYVDSTDWDSLLARAGGRPDPVGVVGRGRHGRRERGIFTDVWEDVAAGASSESIPAYRFSPPCDDQLRGLLPRLDHWQWNDPPSEAETRGAA